jgi:hypothetical protein
VRARLGHREGAGQGGRQRSLPERWLDIGVVGEWRREVLHRRRADAMGGGGGLSAPATQGKGGDCEARQKLGGDQPVVALTGREKMAATAALILACPVVDSRGGVDKRHRGATETTVGARFQ